MYIYFTLCVVAQLSLLYFVVQIVLALALGGSYSWLLHPFDMAPPFWDFFFFLKGFFTFRFHKMLQAPLSFPCPVLESAISPASPCSFYLRLVSRNQDLCFRSHFYIRK